MLYKIMFECFLCTLFRHKVLHSVSKHILSLNVKLFFHCIVRFLFTYKVNVWWVSYPYNVNIFIRRFVVMCHSKQFIFQFVLRWKCRFDVFQQSANKNEIGVESRKKREIFHRPLCDFANIISEMGSITKFDNNLNWDTIPANTHPIKGVPLNVHKMYKMYSTICTCNVHKKDHNGCTFCDVYKRHIFCAIKVEIIHLY